MANVPPEFLNQLRERVALADLVSRHVKLTRRGREYVGLSPFRKERTPSFTVVPDKGFFHCFSSGEHGDAIGFLMRIEGLSFMEAVEKLAAEVGLPMPRESPEAAEAARRRTGLLEVLEAAAAYYERQLGLPVGREASEYLRRRGLDPGTVRRFRLGYAPRDGGLQGALAREGFAAGLIEEAGLVRRGEGEARPRDYMRDRVVFPITDARGRPIAFGGRTMGAAQPKYLNTPESPMFRKGSVLYGLSQARDACHRARGMVVVEGYMDAIALSQAGLGHTVAALGTAFGEGQLRSLWQYADEPVLCFDGDEAGRRAARRAAERALPLLTPGKSLRFAALAGGHDPDTLVRSGGGQAMRTLLENAVPLADLLWTSEMEAVRPDNPDRRAAFGRNLLALTATIADTMVRSYYEAEVAARLQERFGVRLPAPSARSFRGPPRTGTARQPPRAGGGRERAEARLGALRELPRRAILACVVNHPALALEFGQEIADLELGQGSLDKLRHEILGLAAGGEDIDRGEWQTHFERKGLAGAVKGALGGQVRELWPFARPAATEADAREGLKHLFSDMQREQVESDVRAAAGTATRDVLERMPDLVLDARGIRPGFGDGN